MQERLADQLSCAGLCERQKTIQERPRRHGKWTDPCGKDASLMQLNSAASWSPLLVSYVQLWPGLHHWEGLVVWFHPHLLFCANIHPMLSECLHLALGRGRDPLRGQLLSQEWGLSTSGIICKVLMSADLSAFCDRSIFVCLLKLQLLDRVLAQGFLHMLPSPPHPQCLVLGHRSINALRWPGAGSSAARSQGQRPDLTWLVLLCGQGLGQWTRPGPDAVPIGLQTQ